jgi:hypothetical protein
MVNDGPAMFQQACESKNVCGTCHGFEGGGKTRMLGEFGNDTRVYDQNRRNDDQLTDRSSCKTPNPKGKRTE